MRCVRPARVAGAVLAASAVIAPGPAIGAEGPVIVPSQQMPPAAAAVGPLERVLALALSGDGAAAAAAIEAAEAGRSVLRLVTPEGGEPETMELPGIARSLLFSPDGSRLYAVLERPKRRGPGEALLYDMDVGTLRSGAPILLPVTARALAISIEEDTLLVACRDEVRSFRLPALASGPLYRIPGENLAIADLGGGDVLVGQTDGLLRVHLRDPQGRDGLEPRERAKTAEPVVGLAAAPDGQAALARLAGGTVRRVALGPLRLEETGRSGTAVAWLGAPRARGLEEKRPQPQPAPIADRHLEAGQEPAPPRAAGQREQTQTEVGVHEPHAEPEPEAPGETEPLHRGKTEKAPEARLNTEEAPPSSERISTAEAAAASPQAAGLAAGAVRGRVSGPALAGVAAIVLAGPDNLLRIARRVRPSPDGSWSADGLAPGLYRVILSGEKAGVVVTDPGFRTVRVEAGARIEVPEIRAIRIE